MRIKRNSHSELRKKYHQIRDFISKKNKNISTPFIDSYIIFRLLHVDAYSRISLSDFQTHAKEIIDFLFGYQKSNEVFVPIVNLTIPDHPVNFGFIELASVDENDKGSSWWGHLSKFYPSEINNVNCIGRINVVGDPDLSITISDSLIQDYLNYLRGLLLPLDDEVNINFYILGEDLLPRSRPYKRVDTGSRNKDSGSFSLRLDKPIRILDLKTLLAEIDYPRFEKILELITKNQSINSPQMVSKYLRGLRWLGEVTKPDKLESRYIKLAIALESIWGTDAKNDTLATRGIKATIAERAAFLGGTKLEERFDIHKKITKFYDIRSSIVHGDNPELSIGELSKYYALIREIAYRTVDSLADYPSVDKFQEYILRMRYT